MVTDYKHGIFNVTHFHLEQREVHAHFSLSLLGKDRSLKGILKQLHENAISIWLWGMVSKIQYYHTFYLILYHRYYFQQIPWY